MCIVDLYEYEKVFKMLTTNFNSECLSLSITIPHLYI